MPDGTTAYHERRCKQTAMHEIYRRFMMLVDVHNHYRQGEVSISDVWQTTSWVMRHFAEGLGFWEVNTYRALTYFYPQQADMSHT